VIVVLIVVLIAWLTTRPPVQMALAQLAWEASQ